MPDQLQKCLLSKRFDWRQLDRCDYWRMAWKCVVVFGALSLSPCELAFAQQSERPRPDIIVARTIMVRPGSKVPLAIKIGSPEALPKKSFVSLRGLPPSVLLPGWQNVGPGSWTIPLFALPTLVADIPFDVSGRSQVTISLIGMDGSLLAQVQTMLIVGATSIAAPAEEATAAQLPKESWADKPATAPSVKSSMSTLSVEERTRAEQLVAQGEKYLGDANIEAARQFFRRAADAGLALAALRLAATYDPAELVLLQAEGVVANRAEARRWYERARELGATEAEGRLARLGTGAR